MTHITNGRALACYEGAADYPPLPGAVEVSAIDIAPYALAIAAVPDHHWQDWPDDHTLIEYPDRIECGCCEGAGSRQDPSLLCDVCDGEGHLESDRFDKTFLCPCCNGDRYRVKPGTLSCDECDGYGWVVSSSYRLLVVDHLVVPPRNLAWICAGHPRPRFARTVLDNGSPVLAWHRPLNGYGLIMPVNCSNNAKAFYSPHRWGPHRADPLLVDEPSREDTP